MWIVDIAVRQSEAPSDDHCDVLTHVTDSEMSFKGDTQELCFRVRVPSDSVITAVKISTRLVKRVYREAFGERPVLLRVHAAAA